MTTTSAAPNAGPPLVELVRASRWFGRQMVLRDVELEVRQGETLVIIGESGCGKSVTTKLMAGLLEPTSGEVRWGGVPLRERTERELHRERLRIGYLFQGAALFDSLSVFENIAFGLRENTALSPGEIRTVVEERLLEVGLSGDVGRKKPAELSGGMRKRVGLARALALSPEIMFYDEPTTGLDPVMSDVINELILQTSRARHVTSVVVTHDMSTVRRVADRVVMLAPLARARPDEPQILFTGTAEEAFGSADERVARFVRGESEERNREPRAA